jgi:hypothetical protein
LDNKEQTVTPENADSVKTTETQTAKSQE